MYVLWYTGGGFIQGHQVEMMENHISFEASIPLIAFEYLSHMFPLAVISTVPCIAPTRPLHLVPAASINHANNLKIL